MNDNLIAGIAWTTNKSVIKLNDVYKPNKTKVNANIFSLYGLKTIQDNWMLRGSISKGFSITNNQAVRYDGKEMTYALSKYKSKYHAANIEVLKNIKLNKRNIIIEPCVGVSYNRFTSDSYTEHSSIVNWHVAKRTTQNAEALIGGRVITQFSYNNWLFQPFVSSHAHINIFDKKDNIRFSFDEASKEIAFKSPKAQPVWYSNAIGVAGYLGDLEIDTGYEIQIDKKYIGNIITLKLRFEF